MKAEHALRALLAMIGAAELCAVIGIIMPTSCMAWTHQWLGLGTFPDGVVTPYLARGLSAFYMMHGGFLVLTSVDVRRYAAFVRYIAWTGIVFSILITVLDLRAGFPWYWTVGEGPALTAISIAMLVLLRRVTAPGTTTPARG